MTGIKKDGLVNRQGEGGGAGRRLDAAAQQELRAVLASEQQFWTLEQVTSLLAERFGVHYCPRHLRRILHGMGMCHYKPQPADYLRGERAEEQLQQRLQGTFDALLLQQIPLEAVATG